MADKRTELHPVRVRRMVRGWPQAELARRAGISRAAVSAIEGAALTPSVTAALALAAALECSVEELFGGSSEGGTARAIPEWAWVPRKEPCRYWEAEVAGRRWLYPVEAPILNAQRHDGLWNGGRPGEGAGDLADGTLVLAGCDPAAGLLASEYARESGFRLLVFPRGSGPALELLRRGQIHVAGLHRSTVEHPGRNAEAVRHTLGEGFRLIRVARWEEGVALPGDEPVPSTQSLVRSTRRWAVREPGSAARECLDELLGRRAVEGREVDSHAAVAEAVHAGWAGAGVCIRLAAEDAGLNFLPIRKETFDFCFAARLQSDPRVQALIRLLRSRSYRRLTGELPGYDTRDTGEIATA